MYDKHGCGLRVETVMNDPYEFKVRLRCGRPRPPGLGMVSPAKGVAFRPRYAAVATAANHRYLDALAVVDDPAPATARSIGSRSRCGIPTTALPARLILPPRARWRSSPRSSAASTRSGVPGRHAGRHGDPVT